MSLKPLAISPVPAETARIARAAYPKGNVYMQMRDVLGSIYTDEDFADLFPKDGQPAEAPWRLALVTVMQFVENLSDQPACRRALAGENAHPLSAKRLAQSARSPAHRFDACPSQDPRPQSSVMRLGNDACGAQQSRGGCSRLAACPQSTRMGGALWTAQ